MTSSGANCSNSSVGSNQALKSKSPFAFTGLRLFCEVFLELFLVVFLFELTYLLLFELTRLLAVERFAVALFFVALGFLEVVLFLALGLEDVLFF